MNLPDRTLTKGRAVGALACQSDSYQRTLDTVVVSCVQAAKPEQNGGKKKKQEVATHDEWMIECADSVLFPEGGGQPSDHGTLIVMDEKDEKEIPIRNVQRHGLRCILYSPQPLKVGEKIRQVVDWKRRWDHMQQHTGQHLLSAMMRKVSPDLETLGWGMGGEGSMNYVDIPRKPTQEELDSIQVMCTQTIRDTHKIYLETPDDAKASSLPEDYDKEDGVVRVIHIGDFDANTCCGTHLRQTSHVGLITFGGSQTVHGKNCRLQFMAGDRALKLATSSIEAVSAIARVTASKSSPSEVVTKVSEMTESLVESRRSEKKLLLEIAAFESERARAIVQSGKSALVHRANGGIEFINKIIGEVGDTVTGRGAALVVAIGEAKGTGPVIITGDKDAVASMVDKVKAIVTNIKGGGTGDRWQGKVPEWQNAELKQLKALFEQ